MCGSGVWSWEPLPAVNLRVSQAATKGGCVKTVRTLGSFTCDKLSQPHRSHSSESHDSHTSTDDLLLWLMQLPPPGLFKSPWVTGHTCFISKCAINSMSWRGLFQDLEDVARSADKKSPIWKQPGKQYKLGKRQPRTDQKVQNIIWNENQLVNLNLRTPWGITVLGKGCRQTRYNPKTGWEREGVERKGTNQLHFFCLVTLFIEIRRR